MTSDNTIPFKDRRKVSADTLNIELEKNTHRWEIIIYPALFAFILLAAYGFYMVYSLAADMHKLTNSVDRNMNALVSNINAMTESVSQMKTDVHTMSNNFTSVDTKMNTLLSMNDTMGQMNETMDQMNMTIRHMDYSTSHMTMDFHKTARPLRWFNSWVP